MPSYSAAMANRDSSSAFGKSISLPVAYSASIVAGSLEPLVSYPFEFIKTSQQLHSRLNASKLAQSKASPSAALDATTKTVLHAIETQQSRTGFLSVARHVWQKEGLKGFYHGVGVVSSGGAAKVS